jgi:tetratricopeptide (TPR) repeat protein
MALSAHGVVLDQLEVAARMKPDREDTNVTPDEIARFARAQGFVAFAGLNGRTELLRALVSAGIPVIAEQWITVDGRGEMGHYRVVVGYDDAAGEVIVQDSYYGARRRHTYDGFAAEWRPFLGAYVAVARPDQQAALDAALGADIDQGAVVSNLRNQLESEAAGPGDAWTWYRLGEARSLAGDHEGAVGAYEEAIRIGLPTRAFWYQFGFYRSLLETGRAERALAHADATLATMSGENLEESQYWRGRALLALGRPADARASFERALLFNPLFEEARRALNGGG